MNYVPFQNKQSNVHILENINDKQSVVILGASYLVYSNFKVVTPSSVATMWLYIVTWTCNGIGVLNEECQSFATENLIIWTPEFATRLMKKSEPQSELSLTSTESIVQDLISKTSAGDKP